MDAYHARFYDRYFVGVEGDVEFYVDEAREAESPVLEIGCGTGRILLPVARSGASVVGLEPAAPLLAVTREKLSHLPAEVRQRVELVQGDMRDFNLERRLRLVIIPYRTFQHLLSPVDQEQALACIRDHLEEDGRLVFNTFEPLREMIEEGFRGGLRKDTDFVDAETGHQVVVWYSRQFDPEVQVFEQELIFEEVDGSGHSLGRTFGRLALRYASRYEMQYLLELCGFEVEALYGDFQGTPYPGYGEQVWVARKV